MRVNKYKANIQKAKEYSKQQISTAAEIMLDHVTKYGLAAGKDEARCEMIDRIESYMYEDLTYEGVQNILALDDEQYMAWEELGEDIVNATLSFLVRTLEQNYYTIGKIEHRGEGYGQN